MKTLDIGAEVKVKLTDFGRNILVQKGISYQIDASGYAVFKLGSLFNIFGEYITNDHTKLPFEKQIIINDKYLTNYKEPTGFANGTSDEEHVIEHIGYKNYYGLLRSVFRDMPREHVICLKPDGTLGKREQYNLDFSYSNLIEIVHLLEGLPKLEQVFSNNPEMKIKYEMLLDQIRNNVDLHSEKTFGSFDSNASRINSYFVKSAGGITDNTERTIVDFIIEYRGLSSLEKSLQSKEIDENLYSYRMALIVTDLLIFNGEITTYLEDNTEYLKLYNEVAKMIKSNISTYMNLKRGETESGRYQRIFNDIYKWITYNFKKFYLQPYYISSEEQIETDYNRLRRIRRALGYIESNRRLPRTLMANPRYHSQEEYEALSFNVIYEKNDKYSDYVYSDYLLYMMENGTSYADSTREKYTLDYSVQNAREIAEIIVLSKNLDEIFADDEEKKSRYKRIIIDFNVKYFDEIEAIMKIKEKDDKIKIIQMLVLEYHKQKQDIIIDDLLMNRLTNHIGR